jgi:hypothetical protein
MTQARRSGAVALGDLAGRLEVLRVTCWKCERVGIYSVAALIERYGPDTGLPDWKDAITANCPLRASWPSGTFAVRTSPTCRG